jgi:hypothetical protein
MQGVRRVLGLVGRTPVPSENSVRARTICEVPNRVIISPHAGNAGPSVVLCRVARGSSMRVAG